MNKNQKIKALKVKELKESFANLQTIILFKNNSLNVSTIQEFKKEIRVNNAFFKVYKNRLLKRVFEDTKLNDLNNSLIGPLMFIYSHDSSLDLIKKIFKFKVKNKGTEVVAGFFDKKILDSSQLDELSKLPSYEELLQRFVGLMKSPLSNLVLTFKEIIKNKEKV